MRLVSPAKILLFILLFLPAQRIFTQSTPQATDSEHFLYAKMSVYEFGRRRMPWLMRHPNLATKRTTSRSLLTGIEHVSAGYRVNYPTLDIYSSAGVPLYFSDSPELNEQVIDALPQVIPEPDLNPKYEVRPSLREVLSMIPSIPRKDRATPAQIEYTVLSISLDPPDPNASEAEKKAIQRDKNKPTPGPKVIAVRAHDPHPLTAAQIAAAVKKGFLHNRAQEEAIERLKARLNGSGIRVIEVRLQQ